MDRSLQRRILDNLIPSAYAAVEPWDSFPWHTNRQGASDTWQPNSSQALAIDVFGTLKAAKPDERDAVLDAIATELGVPGAGPWQVELEWTDPLGRLCEPRKTQVDALARSPETLILFECKFTEGGGGSCSQTGGLTDGANRGIAQCDGAYHPQTNPINGLRASCALSAKGIRYWETIPQTFRYSAESQYEPCPFAGPWYQWMRNIVLCHEVAGDEGLRPAVVIAYADGPGLPFAEHVSASGMSDFETVLRPEAVALRTVPYQALLKTAETAVSVAGIDPGKWCELRTWVNAKIDAVVDLSDE